MKNRNRVGKGNKVGTKKNPVQQFQTLAGYSSICNIISSVIIMYHR